MIVFDCERLKHENTGLYHYTLNLAKALADETAKREDKRLVFYVNEERIPLLDGKAGIKKVGICDRAVLYDRKAELWHISSQLSHYQPLNGKKVLTVHDLNYLYESLTNEERKKLIVRVNKNLRRCSAVVAISEYVKNDILEHLDLKDVPVEVIHNGCNLYTGPVVEPRDRPFGKFLFAVGNVMPKKNFHVLPRLLAENDYCLVVSGQICSEDYRRKIIDEAVRFGVADRVRITGPISDAEKHWYLRNCEAFLHPSLAEGFGLPVLEAMQYGKPIFISDHTCLPEIGGDVAYYFNHDFDAEAMQNEFAQGMDDFRNGGKTAEEIIRHANSFSWSAAARQHLDLYDRLLNG